MTDDLRFAQIPPNGGELEGARILSPKTVDRMRTDLPGSVPGYGFGPAVAANSGPAATASVGSAGEYYRERRCPIGREFQPLVYQTILQEEK
jgi:hypothetical protein